MNDDIDQRRTGKLPSGEVEQPCIYTAPTPEALKKQRRATEEQLRRTRLSQLLKHPAQHYRLLLTVKEVDAILRGPTTDEVKLRLITQAVASILVEYRGVVDHRVKYSSAAQVVNSALDVFSYLYHCAKAGESEKALRMEYDIYAANYNIPVAVIDEIFRRAFGAVRVGNDYWQARRDCEASLDLLFGLRRMKR